MILEAKYLYKIVIFKNLKINFKSKKCGLRLPKTKDPEQTKKIPLKFIAYTFGYEKGLIVNNQSDFKKLNEWGFKTNPLNILKSGVKNLIKNYQEIEKKELI